MKLNPDLYISPTYVLVRVLSFNHYNCKLWLAWRGEFGPWPSLAFKVLSRWRGADISNQTSATRSSTASNFDERTKRSPAYAYDTARRTQVYTRSDYETTPTAPPVEHRRQQNTSCWPAQFRDSSKTNNAASASASTDPTTSRPSSQQHPAQTSSTTGSCQSSVNCKQPYSNPEDYTTSIFIVKKRSWNINSVRVGCFSWKRSSYVMSWVEGESIPTLRRCKPSWTGQHRGT